MNTQRITKNQKQRIRSSQRLKIKQRKMKQKKN